MLMRPFQVRPGDHVDGATVLWVGSATYPVTVVIALDTELPNAAGTVTRLRRYDPDELVAVNVETAASTP